MNKCIFVARLTRDPEVRYSQAEEPIAIASFCGAVDRKIKRKDEPEADFLNFKAFGKIAEVVEKYAKKGTKFVIEARVQTGSYTNKDGVKVYTTDFVVESIEFSESKQNGSSSGQCQQANENSSFMEIPETDMESLPFN